MNGVLAVVRSFITIFLVSAFIAFVAYIVYYIFFKRKRTDVPFENWKQYLRSALDNGPDMMEDLVLSGDQKHASKRFMTIKGYLRIRGIDNKEYDMFVGKRKPMNFFEEYKIVMMSPDQHSDLIGDVYANGISLVMKFGYYFLNTSMMNTSMIDQQVSFDTYRTMLYMTLGDFKHLIDRASGLDSEFSKQQSSQKILKLPILSGQGEQPPKPGP